MRTKLLVAIFAFLVLSECRAATFVNGIDVSRWQPNVDWNAVKADGIDFAFVKATEGVNYVDPEYHAHMQGAISAGVLVGTYHFARIDSFDGVPFTSYDGSPFLPGTDPYVDAVGEANDFIDAMTPYLDTGLHLPPVADVEGLPDFGDLALEREFISNWVQVFSDTIDDALGRRPIIYTSKFGANNRYTSEVAASHDLWLAWWKNSTANPPVQSDTPLFPLWDFWQWTATGSVAGISGNVDRNVFNGTMEELEALLIGTDPNGPGVYTDITNFEVDEGYFRWPTNYSGANQGIGASSTAVRTDSEAQEGNWSQEIYIDGDSEGWFYRHLAGLSTPVANPATNLELDSTGSVGFWVKTDDPGVSVQIAIDDVSGTERGISQALIADGQWHLYEWDFEDALQWESWLSGDGAISASTVTIDSILFEGDGEATFFLDTVAHNPNGSLAPQEGDFDGDGDIDFEDFMQWQGDFGINGESDSDQDSDSDGLDFLAWQSNFASPPAPLGQFVALPEPTTAALFALGLLGVIGCRRSQFDR